MEIAGDAVAHGDEPDARQRPRELALSAAWNGGLTRRLTTIDGRDIAVVFGGHWTHGFGPDFADAMLDISGEGLLAGAVEIHYRTSDWNRHGHHLDPRYNAVILHVVSRHDMVETRRPDGGIVPVAVLTVPDEMLFQIDARLPEIWSRLGGTVCAEELTARAPGVIIRALQALGDERLQERIVRFEGDLTAAVANQVLLAAIFDGFGYSANREAMRELHDLIARHGLLESIASGPEPARLRTATTLLFGFAGFLPLVPGDLQMARMPVAMQQVIETTWAGAPTTWQRAALSPLAWQRGRSRPANHPAVRLMSLAAVLARSRTDLLATTLAWFRNGDDAVARLRDLAAQTHDGAIQLGKDRATSLVASVLIPFAIAYARHINDPSLEESAIATWDGLAPGAASHPVKRALAQVAGATRLRGLGERGAHGLLHLDRDYCTPRRCFACPIAAEVIRDERRRPPSPAGD